MSAFRGIGVVAACLVVFLLGVAWVLPPLWDWSRQRDTMEAFAAAALGRPVRIEGAIGLTLLPEPMLTAGRVRVQGDAGAGELRIRSLRLGVALGPLIRGRVVARDLVLVGPELRLPWPPGDGASPGMSPGIVLPSWYAGFAGRIEDGQLRLGALSLRDIQATVSAGDDGALNIAGRVQAGGQAWQLAARIGQPGEDGIAGIELTSTGRDRGAGTVLAVNGAVGGKGGLSGRLTLHGPDLSVWMPAPAVTFRGEGSLDLGSAGWDWRNVALELAGVPARGELGLVFAPAPALRAGVSAARFDLDAWLPVLWRIREAGLPVSLAFGADAATLGGGTLRQLQAALSSADGAVRLESGSVLLPGEALLRLAGDVRAEADGPAFNGQAKLDAPDPRASLRWLAGLLGGLPPALAAADLPVDVLRHVSLATAVELGTGRLALRDIAGRVDQNEVHGQLAFTPGQRPALRAEVGLDQLALDPLLPPGARAWPDALAALTGISADVQIRVRAASLAGRSVDGLVLEAALEPDRLAVRKLEGSIDGARVSASGVMDVAGRLADGKLEINATSAAPLAGWLPVAWRGGPALWDGRVALRVEASGPPDALALQLGLDLGDARLEAQPVLDLAEGRVAGRMTLRHPNAGRLLMALGLAPGSQGSGWLGEGSLALQAQFGWQGDDLSVDGFELTAGAFRGSGRFGVLWQRGQGGLARLGGRITADSLPLPWPRAGLDQPLPIHLLRGWSGSLQIQAAQALLDGEPVLERLVCLLSQDAGVVRLSGCEAKSPEGGVQIEASLDSSASPPALAANIAIKGGRIESLIPGLPAGADPAFDLRAERADLTMDLRAAGHSPAALRASLSGAVRFAARDGAWTGFDLPAARAALAAARGRGAAETAVALRAALAQGYTPFDQMELQGSLSGRVLDLSAATSSGPFGSVALSGQFGLDGDVLDLRTALLPAKLDGIEAEPPRLGLRLNGPIAAPQRVIDVAEALRWLAVLPP